MCLKAAAICLLSVVLSGLVQQGNTACQELKPVDGFKNDYFAGKLYWIVQKIAYDNQDESKCYMTYSFVDDNIWTFIDMNENNQGYENFVKEVGVMDTPGHWNVSTAHPNGTPFTYSLTAIGGMSKKYVLLYSCNPDNGEYALWLFYYKRVSPGQIDQETKKAVSEDLKRNKLTTAGAKPIDNRNCDCK